MSQELFDAILEQFGAGAYQTEVRAARAQYFERLADMREDDPSYERLTQCFLYWYVIDRPLDGGAETPLQRFAGELERSDPRWRTCAELAASVHGLFEVLRLEPGGAQLRELFTLEPLRVSERRQLAGLERGDVLEARLVPIGDRLVFASGAFVHQPRAAGALIQRAVTRARQQGRPAPEALMAQLRALAFRYSDRFRERVPVEKVYGGLAG